MTPIVLYFEIVLTSSSSYFIFLESVEFQRLQVFKIVCLILSIIRTSSYYESFSLVPSPWRAGGNRCSVKLIRNAIIIYLKLEYRDNLSEFAQLYFENKDQ